MADPDARARKHDAPVSRRPGRALAAAFCTAADEVRDCSRPRTQDKGQSHEVLKPPQLASSWSSLHSRFLSREGRLQPRARRSRALTATSENRPPLDFFWGKQSFGARSDQKILVCAHCGGWAVDHTRGRRPSEPLSRLARGNGAWAPKAADL